MGHYRRNIPALAPLHPDVSPAVGAVANAPVSSTVLLSSQQELSRAHKMHEAGVLSEVVLSQRMERHAKIQGEHAAMDETAPDWGQGLSHQIQHISHQLQQVITQMNQMNTQMTQGFNGVDQRFSQVEKRLTALEVQSKNSERRRKNLEVVRFHAKDPLLPLFKQYTLPGYVAQTHGAPPSPVSEFSVGDLVGGPAFPQLLIGIERMTTADVNHFVVAYNNEFGIVATDDIVAKRAKFREFLCNDI